MHSIKRSIGSFGRRILLGAMILLAGVTANPQTSAAKDKNKEALWAANGTNVLVFNLNDFKKGTHDSKPDLILTSANGFVNVQGVVFDANTNLGVIDAGNVSVGGTVPPSMQEFSRLEVLRLVNKLHKKTVIVTPTVTLTSPGFLISPRQGVFDSVGNMWVTDDGANAIFVFNPTQLATGGAQTPNVTILSSTLSPFSWPVGIAFDPSWNLWVANNAGNSIYKFNASTLPGPTITGLVSLIPDVVLSDNGANSIQAPWGLALDGVGNLWATNAGSQSTVVEFANDDLGVTGNPNPALTLSPTTDKNGNTDLSAPEGIAFDNVGNLDVISSAKPFGIAHFAVAGGGAAVAALLLSKGKLNGPAGCTFGPSVK